MLSRASLLRELAGLGIAPGISGAHKRAAPRRLLTPIHATASTGRVIGAALPAPQFSRQRAPTPHPAAHSFAARACSARAMSADAAPSGEPARAGISQALWADARPEVARSLFHPFITALGRGDLPRAAFQHYVGQDAYFLDAFGRAYALAAARSHGKPPEVTEGFLELMKGVFEELQLHSSYAEEWGVDLASCQPSTATLAYTDFVLEVANGEGSLGEVLAAMAPCMRLYAFLGAQLAVAVPEAARAGNPYAGWIEAYSSPEFQALADKLEEMLDVLGKESSDGTLRHLYQRAMQLEADFFSAQPYLPPAKCCIGLLVTDFDDTCTSADTTPIIIEAAIQGAEKAAPSPEAGQDIRHERSVKLSAVLNLMIAEKAELMESIVSERGAEQSPSFDSAALCNMLSRLSDFDRRMNEEAFAAGLLEGLDPAAVAGAAGQVELQPGAVGALHAAAAADVDLHVLSVSWSGNLIRAALGLSEAQLGIHANTLDLRDDGLCSGATSREIQCADDKTAAFQQLLASEAAALSEEGRLSVYLGDSATDLGALLEADVGIIVGTSSALQQIAAAAGVRVRPLLEAALGSSALVSGSPKQRGVLFRADSWSDIHALLSQCFPSPPASGQAAAPAWSPNVPRALTIAGSDSGGGAGIQADLKAFLANGVFGMSAITALTAQNTQGVQGVFAVEPAFVTQQMDSVLGDIGAGAVKTGMLPSADVIRAVAAALKRHGAPALVVDPVLISTSGDSLAEDGVGAVMISDLFPLATIITPNMDEASVLLGGRPVTTMEEMKKAAAELHKFGPQYVLLKGGHLKGSTAVDVLYDGHEYREYANQFIPTGNTHGTGCTLAAAIAAELAKGASPPAAVARAKGYLSQALARSATLCIGNGSQRPFNHGFATADWALMDNRSAVDYSVYAVTDRACNAAAGRSAVEAAAAAIDGGATVIQLREKDIGGGEFSELARRVIAIARPRGVPVLINDRIDVALAAGADGVHVGQSDIALADARRLLGSTAIIGISAGTVAEAVAAADGGADYVGVGALYPTATKPDADHIGLDALAEVRAAVRLPIVGIGGVTAGNAAAVVGAGADGVAVVSAIFAAPDVAAATREIRDAVGDALRARGT
eukprot:jgi/Tetstr1/435155/TSEL_002612.t1